MQRNKCWSGSLKMDSPCLLWNRSELEREMFSLISAGLTFCQLRGIRKEKRGRTCFALPFMVPGEVCPGRMAWLVLIGWDLSFQNSNGKTIPALNNGLQFFLLHPFITTVSPVNQVIITSFFFAINAEFTKSTA